jgi:hypothetical protein
MQIRLNEGSSDVSAAFTEIGLDFDRISGFVAAGDEGWADYFNSIMQGLQSIENPMRRSQLQAEIFGTQAEDLGVSFSESARVGAEGMIDFAGATAGATDKLTKKYDTLGGALEVLQRKGLVALEPLGKGMLEALNNVMPKITAFFDDVLGPAIARFGEGAGPIFEDFVNKLTSTVGPAMELISDALKRINIAFGGTGEQTDIVSTALSVLGGILDAIIFGIQAVAIAFQGVAWAIEQVVAGVKTAGKWLDGLGDTMSGIADALPDWLQPGSPPPLAIGLGNIADQLKAMPDMAGIFGAGNQTVTASGAAIAATPAAAGDGRGGVTVIVQGSINGDDHLKRVVMESFDMLNMALAGGA